MNVHVAVTDVEIDACYPAMQELRPHLRREDFVDVVCDLQRDGYTLAYLSAAETVLGVAGFRIQRALYCDKFLYVDDLVVVAAERSKGYGKVLLAWLEERAQAEGCAQVHLSSGIQRHDAHRFYQKNGMMISGYRFRSELNRRVPWSRR